MVRVSGSRITRSRNGSSKTPAPFKSTHVDDVARVDPTLPSSETEQQICEQAASRFFTLKSGRSKVPLRFRYCDPSSGSILPYPSIRHRKHCAHVVYRVENPEHVVHLEMDVISGDMRNMTFAASKAPRTVLSKLDWTSFAGWTRWTYRDEWHPKACGDQFSLFQHTRSSQILVFHAGGHNVMIDVQKKHIVDLPGKVLACAKIHEKFYFLMSRNLVEYNMRTRETKIVDVSCLFMFTDWVHGGDTHRHVSFFRHGDMPTVLAYNRIMYWDQGKYVDVKSEQSEIRGYATASQPIFLSSRKIYMIENKTLVLLSSSTKDVLYVDVHPEGLAFVCTAKYCKDLFTSFENNRIRFVARETTHDMNGAYPLKHSHLWIGSSSVLLKSNSNPIDFCSHVMTPVSRNDSIRFSLQCRNVTKVGFRTDGKLIMTNPERLERLWFVSQSDIEKQMEDIPAQNKEIYVEDEDNNDKIEDTRSETSDVPEGEFIVEAILEHHVEPDDSLLYKVQWEGYEDPTWEPEENLEHSMELVALYWKNIALARN